jgi:hypothetical protein
LNEHDESKIRQLVCELCRAVIQELLPAKSAIELCKEALEQQIAAAAASSLNATDGDESAADTDAMAVASDSTTTTTTSSSLPSASDVLQSMLADVFWVLDFENEGESKAPERARLIAMIKEFIAAQLISTNVCVIFDE